MTLMLKERLRMILLGTPLVTVTDCHIFLHQDPESLKKTQGVGPIRKVLLSKEDHEGLGISITVRIKFLLQIYLISYMSKICETFPDKLSYIRIVIV